MDGIPALAMESSAVWPLDIIRRLALRVHTLLDGRTYPSVPRIYPLLSAYISLFIDVQFLKSG